jgi:glycogen phosphorylase
MATPGSGSTTARQTLAEQLPDPLRPLARLAFNFWWTWQPDGEALWSCIDPEAWNACERNPVRLLRELPRRTLLDATSDAAIRDRMASLASRLDAYLARPPSAASRARPDAPVAFLCSEYAIDASLPIYSGGLGVLAGDLLKEASDRAQPVVAVGMLYRRGYFHQRLDPTGMQHEYWTVSAPARLAIERVEDARGAPLSVDVPLRSGTVHLAIYRADVGRVPLFLLDSDVPSNGAVDRFITSQLYIGDPTYRLMQYVVGGFGAVRALSAMGIEPALYHFNEGHPAFAALELMREPLARGEPLDRVLADVRRRVVFTTHTPVPAGNETYPTAQVETVLAAFLRQVGGSGPALLDLGRVPGDDPGRPFGMSDLALRTSGVANAVSRRHGEVARGLWAGHWPGRPIDQVPITHVTNGVHLPTWMSGPMRALLERYLGPAWLEDPDAPSLWERVDAIGDGELWSVRKELRAALVAFIRERAVRDRLARGESLEYVERAAAGFDPEVLTIGFARRVASYKRLHLLVADPQRALRDLAGARPIQVVIAGKAHPRDEGAKRIVQVVFGLKGAPVVGARVAYVEDYDLDVARILVAGCDAWVNLPRPPAEASGTSGMKAALNGNLNLSVLDGWWCEGFDGENGWAIRSEPGPDDAAQDARDADAFYGILEREVVPEFYDRDAEGLPRRWLRRVRRALRTIGPAFNTARMLGDYEARVYGREERSM